MKYSVIKIVCHWKRKSSFNHGRIIKWTQHIGFLTLAVMERVVEGNHGNDSKRRASRILCLSSLAKFDYSLHFYFYKRKTKQMRACVIA